MAETTITLTNLPNELIIDTLILEFSNLLDTPLPIYTSHILPHTGSLSTTFTLWDTWTLSTTPLYTTALALAYTSKALAPHVLYALELIIRTDGTLPKLSSQTCPMTEAEHLSDRIIDGAGDDTTALTKTEVEDEMTLPTGFVTLHTLRGTLAAVRQVVEALRTAPFGTSTMAPTFSTTYGQNNNAGTAFITKIRVVETTIKTRVHGSGFGNWRESRKWAVEAVNRGKSVRLSKSVMEEMEWE